MSSIRLSLNIYLALLLFLALIGVLTVLYQRTLETLVAKEESTFNFMATENRNRVQELDKDFDNKILDRARELVSKAQSQFVQEKTHHDLMTLTFLTAHLRPEGIGEPLAKHLHQWHVFRRPFIKLEANLILAVDHEGQPPFDYFQVYNADGEPLQQSRSLGNQAFTLDSQLRNNLKLHEHHFDDTQLTAKGPRLRRVTLRVPVASVSVKRSPPPAGPGSPGFLPRGAGPPPITETLPRPVPFLFFQYAQDAGLHDKAVQSYQRDFEVRVAIQEADAAATLLSLKTRLLWIFFGTFAATVVGASWLIKLGLSPLQRLSEAVSRVSEKDFRLPFDPAELPTELRPIFDRLTQTLEMLKRAFAREKQAAADISHELRTPLAALLTTLEVGLRRPRTPERYAELLRECHAIGRQMTQLVERLLALARIDAGADSLRAQEVDVAALVVQCADLVRPLAEARNLSLQLHCAGPARVTTDQNKLREVLTNLLHNAIEYNRPRGRIDVLVERRNSHLQVAVRDTGVGIPAQALDHVFERFYRVDESRQADSLHAGVGLAIVKGYLELMGGSIAVQSTEGQGSTFTVQLPVRPL
jgi:heavy metal sensor kinase